jgi:hypothetical protein
LATSTGILDACCTACGAVLPPHARVIFGPR